MQFALCGSGVQGITAPPLTSTIAPVIYEQASEARKTITCAISDGSARRLSGTPSMATSSEACGRLVIRRVFTVPGAMQLTRMLFGAKWRAKALVMDMMPALLAL